MGRENFITHKDSDFRQLPILGVGVKWGGGEEGEEVGVN